MGCSLHTDMTEITERNNMKTKEKQAMGQNTPNDYDDGWLKFSQR